MSLRTAALVLVFFASSFLLSQTQAPAAPPQTPRQALIEVINGGQEGAMKHLTVEMQKSLQGDGKSNSSVGQLAAFEVRERFYEIGSAAGIRDTAEFLLR